jgi:hypothetical protein
MTPEERAAKVVRNVAGTAEFRAALYTDVLAVITDALKAQQANLNNVRAGLNSWRELARTAEATVSEVAGMAKTGLRECNSPHRAEGQFRRILERTQAAVRKGKQQ